MILKFKEKTQVLLLFPICVFHCQVAASINGNTVLGMEQVWWSLLQYYRRPLGVTTLLSNA